MKVSSLLQRINYKECSIDACDKPVKGRGWCAMHWRRWRVNGDPLTVKQLQSEDFKLADGRSAWDSQEYGVWCAMKARCHNKNDKAYLNYGGRGIKVCERWQGINGFKRFMEDMGYRPKGLTLDRIDNDGNYEPSNCRWVNRNQQVHNRRTYGQSGYKGVFSYQGKWLAQLSSNYKSVYLGIFEDIEQAALAYDAAVVQLYGQNAKTNILEIELC